MLHVIEGIDMYVAICRPNLGRLICSQLVQLHIDLDLIYFSSLSFHAWTVKSNDHQVHFCRLNWIVLALQCTNMALQFLKCSNYKITYQSKTWRAGLIICKLSNKIRQKSPPNSAPFWGVFHLNTNENIYWTKIKASRAQESTKFIPKKKSKKQENQKWLHNTKVAKCMSL
jgi:hypothetical protein